MTDIHIYWIGEIRDCPIALPEDILGRQGVVMVCNTRSSDAIDELMEYCEPFEEHGREFDDFDMYYGIKLPKEYTDGKRRKGVAWVSYEKKPPELEFAVRNMLHDLIINDKTREPIYHMLTLAPWMIEALARPLPVDEVEGA